MSTSILHHDGVVSKVTELLPRYLKVPAAVRYSGISRSQLYEEMRRGSIRSYSLKGKHQARGPRLVDRLSLEAWVESHTVGEQNG